MRAESGRWAAFQFQGNSSCTRVCGNAAMRPRTSANHACGSTSLSLAVAMRVYIAAARSPPRSEPANSHDFLPGAIPRRQRSAALFVRQMRPSSRKRMKPSLEHDAVDAKYRWLDRTAGELTARESGVPCPNRAQASQLPGWAVRTLSPAMLSRKCSGRRRSQTASDVCTRARY